MDKLDLLLQKMDSFDNRFTVLDGRMDAMEKHMMKLQTDVSELKTDVSKLQTDVAALQAEAENTREKIVHLEEAVDDTRKSLEEKLHLVNLRIENELIHGVHIVADGHFDLVRILDKALESDYYREELMLRMIRVEHEVEVLKRQQAAFA